MLEHFPDNAIELSGSGQSTPDQHFSQARNCRHVNASIVRLFYFAFITERSVSVPGFRLHDGLDNLALPVIKFAGRGYEVGIDPPAAYGLLHPLIRHGHLVIGNINHEFA